ncbi:MAG: trypsin-like serine protease [Elusimicrobia bacterium]|nr:trypsin-like serine protease [Elusimicrobiota bacterium]
MKKFLLLLLILPLPSLLPAEVSFVSVTGTDEYTNVKDFNNAYDIRISAGGGKEYKCQAVRVLRNWFFTAAHCVAQSCAKDCTIRIILFKNDTYEVYTEVKNTKKKQTVFYDKHFSLTNSFDKRTSDIAAFKYMPSEQRGFFVDAVKHILYTQAQFLAVVPGARSILKKVNSKNDNAPDTPLVSFTNNYFKINRIISLISIDGAAKSVKISGDFVEDSDGNKNPAYFLKNLRIVMLKNFGSKKGLSGSGMMTNTGELIGINSFGTDFKLQINGKDVSVPEYAGFATFNDRSLKFLEDAMGDDYTDLTIYDALEHNFAEPAAYSKLPAPLKVFIKQYNK